MKTYQSWGRYPRVTQTVEPVLWRQQLPDLSRYSQKILAYGNGRSYGDVCLNDQGVLFDMGGLDHFLDFYPETGLLKVEAGVTLASILDQFVARGWFLPVTPGTKYVTVGGAIANDIHGKNHHRAGTFGCHVLELELLRSSGDRLYCSKEQNSDLFRATIGGLGLTGLILSASLKLIPIASPFIEMESIRFDNLDEFSDISAASDKDFDYSVAWVDCLSQGDSLGRGIFMRGNFSKKSKSDLPRIPRSIHFKMPLDAPGFLLNPVTVSAFNHLYYGKQREKIIRKQIYYEPFFYPLDVLEDWNRMYGSRGFFQYQCVVPPSAGSAAMKSIFGKIAASGHASFLTVLKTFGEIQSPGLMSFPKKGLTLALDFPNKGAAVLNLMEDLDDIVRQCGGSVNPSKDARMSPKSFQTFYPEWREFSKWIDPKFSSSFWRRVTNGLIEP